MCFTLLPAGIDRPEDGTTLLAEKYVVRDGERRDELKMLVDDGASSFKSLCRRKPTVWASPDDDFTVVRTGGSAEATQQCRLPRTIRTKKRMNRARRNIHVDAPQHVIRSIRFADSR
ncbi:hypothetical protein GCM10010212_13740 [Paenarthrobacter nicotinovorans]|nr:hypothetical protein GCM10010212_13740 [Paenarthrobacter nicotinovorans]